MAGVVHVEHENGDQSIGVVVDGTYVPFASVTGARVAGLQERAANLAERAKADPDDKAVAEAYANLPTSKPKASGGKDKEADETNGEGA